MNKFLYFFVIITILAILDGFNFQVPYDTGFWSLNTVGGMFKPDIWHTLKIGILAWIAIRELEKKDLVIDIRDLIYFGLIAFFGQIIIYNICFKFFVQL